MTDIRQQGNTSATERQRRAAAIAAAGGLNEALIRKTLARAADVSLSEGLVLGLIKQEVRSFFVVLGHGSTDLGEVLRVYAAAGAIRVLACRNEIEMSHAATALRWQYGETAAVVTSIGPGALQAMAGSLAAASNGIGVYHIYGDETTHGEGYNMQQIPKPQQDLYGRITAMMGESYVLHTPRALRDCLRRGNMRVHRSAGAGPFYILLPINCQPAAIPQLNLAALPERLAVRASAIADDDALDRAAALIRSHRRIVIKAGGGCRAFPQAIADLADAADAVVALAPGALGVLPDDHARNMLVGGSKGTLCGNFAMANADLAIVAGSRAVCQSDCSGTGYERAEAVININADLADAAHYNRTIALVGDGASIIGRLIDRLRTVDGPAAGSAAPWLRDCTVRKNEWRALKLERYACPPLHDPKWNKPVLTQPVAIKAVCDFAKSIGALKLFDAGDVQAHGFQIAEDERVGETITETGASYMGFAASALLAGAMVKNPRYAIAFSGDGSFFMNPQILVDAVAHGVRGMIVVFDNRRMAAISALQVDQYGADFATDDPVCVDYTALAAAVQGVRALFGGYSTADLQAALTSAHAHDGLSLIHVPVYYGPDERSRLGSYGRWNVGNWCDDVQARYHSQDL